MAQALRDYITCGNCQSCASRVGGCPHVANYLVTVKLCKKKKKENMQCKVGLNKWEQSLVFFSTE